MLCQAHDSLHHRESDDKRLFPAKPPQGALPIGRVEPEEILSITQPNTGPGIWVCGQPVESLSPALLIQALCPEHFPLPACASPTQTPVSAGRQPAEVSLLHGFHNASSEEQDRLHFFASRLDTPCLLKHKFDLTDWQFPVPLVAIVLLLEKSGGQYFVDRLASYIGLSRRDTLGWAKAQGLPVVLGVMGLDAGSAARHHSLGQWEAGSWAQVVVGPPPTRSHHPVGRAQTATRRFELSSLLGAGDLRFDDEYATRILSALREGICSKATHGDAS